MTTEKERERPETEDKYEDAENQIKEFFNFIVEQYELAEKWEAIKTFLEDHPVAGVFLIVIIGMSAVPIVVFAIFVITSVALTLTGFFLFEGTVIAFGTFVLGIVLFFVGLFAISFSLFLITVYYLYQTSGSMLRHVRGKIPYIPFISQASTEGQEDKQE